MIEVDLSIEPEWGTETNWQEICEDSVAAAIEIAPFSALTRTHAVISISIVFANNDMVQGLNHNYRQKDKPTNILSFPMVQPDLIDGLANTDDGEILLGDMILAHQICVDEALEKNIPLTRHVTHLIVHGTLHLLGFDHMNDVEAETMEAMEVKALASMGLGNPYSD